MTTPKIPKYYRQRFLLVLLEMSGSRLSKMDFQKLLFLSQKEAGFSYYDFVPYHYGCYSFQAQSDIELLETFGWLEDGLKSINLLAKPKTFCKMLNWSPVSAAQNGIKGCVGGIKRVVGFRQELTHLITVRK